MIRHLTLLPNGTIFERTGCGSGQMYHGFAARVMRLVLEYSR